MIGMRVFGVAKAEADTRKAAASAIALAAIAVRPAHFEVYFLSRVQLF